MKQRGLTLIELTIALTIVALLFAAVVTGMGSITGSQARATAAPREPESSGWLRLLLDTVDKPQFLSGVLGQENALGVGEPVSPENP